MNSRSFLRLSGVVAFCATVVSCGPEPEPETKFQPLEVVQPRPDIYADFTLTADLSELTDNQRQMIALLIDASQIMDDLYWRQSFGDDHESWLESIADADTRRFAELNYGPWDRLDADKPFMQGVGAKPPGANFYPADMSKEEFEEAYLPGKNGLYSLIRRDQDGGLKLIPYHVAYADELKAAADILRQAAKLAVSTDFASYLKLRAAALISDEYQVSDMF
ncbi:MAG: Zn-dependent hydrolase, partial [Proteobacteria bacterium]|nr:Zn-dependent hydrolase [Pseudomonadota bacterium]